MGSVIVQFVVDKDGQVTNPKALRNPCPGCGAAALAAVEAMNEQGIRFVPGKQGGRAVRVRYHLPIKINLQ
jgi:protein TonB